MKPERPPYEPGDGGTLVEISGNVTTVPTWRAKELIADGLAKLAVVRIVYPETWPHLASVVYPEGKAVVIERPVDLTDKPPAHPHLPDDRNGGR